MKKTVINPANLSFTHDSETITNLINNLIRDFKPQEDNKTLTITEDTDLDDYGNEYQLTLKYPSDSADDLTEEIQTSLTEHMPSDSETDFMIGHHIDQTSNHHFLFLTFSK